MITIHVSAYWKGLFSKRNTFASINTELPEKQIKYVISDAKLSERVQNTVEMTLK